MAPAAKPALCGAKRKQGGGTCKHEAGWGTDHPGHGKCKLHGGATPNHRRAAQREIAAEAVATYGLPREVAPHQALEEELWRAAGHVAFLAAEVASLDDAELTAPVGVAGESEDGVRHHPRFEPHVLVRLYQSERRHLAEIAKTCIAVGLEERRVQVAERQGELLAKVIRGVLSDLGVADRPEVPKVVRRHLALVGSDD